MCVCVCVTHCLQLVHQFGQELPALRASAVQLHARLHGEQPACRAETESRRRHVVAIVTFDPSVVPSSHDDEAPRTHRGLTTG